MKHKETIIVPAEKKEVIKLITCDLCGNDIPKSGYQFDRITIEREKGWQYPEGGHREKTIFDCCVDCWVNKVLPAFMNIGAAPYNEELDW